MESLLEDLKPTIKSFRHLKAVSIIKIPAPLTISQLELSGEDDLKLFINKY